MPVVMYGNETVIWSEKKNPLFGLCRCINNLKNLLGIREIHRMANSRVRELCNVKKG